MPRIAEQAGPVTGGVDTHADVQVAAVAGRVGRVLGTGAFPASPAGYRAALAWMSAHGALARIGVEGTGSYGAGLARYLAARGSEVAEVVRPNRQARRQRGKSGAAGAVAAALAALSGEASAMPNSRDGAAEAGPGAAGGPGRRGQGPHPGRQPAARPDPHRTPGRCASNWPGCPPGGRPAWRPGSVPAARHARPRAPRRRWPASPAATSS